MSSTTRNTKKMTFVICLGLPGSGKSTFCAELQRKLKEGKVSCITVSRDALRTQEDGSYLYDPKREPLVQDAHLELLYHLSEQRTTDVVIIDDANLRYRQMISTLLAIDNPDNSVLLVKFEPFSPERHIERTRKNGHIIPLERLVYLTKSYSETAKGIEPLGIKTYTVCVEEPRKPGLSFDQKQEACVGKTTDIMLWDILNTTSRFTLLDYRALIFGEIKRHIFEQYKKTLMDKPSCTCPSASKRIRLDESIENKESKESEESGSENESKDSGSESESEDSGSEDDDEEGQKTNHLIEEEDEEEI